jgi:hypothetical protein
MYVNIEMVANQRRDVANGVMAYQCNISAAMKASSGVAESMSMNEMKISENRKYGDVAKIS